MRRGIAHSLSAKVFLLTAALLTAGCLALYLAVACALPGGYRALSGARAEEGAPGPFPKFPSAAPQTGPELPSGDRAPAPDGPAAQQRKPAEATSSGPSPAAAQGPEPRGPGVVPPLLFLSKQQGKVTAFLIEATCLRSSVLPLGALRYSAWPGWSTSCPENSQGRRVRR